jgi:uncharacterized membrane protein YidH (DUF202 family)
VNAVLLFVGFAALLALIAALSWYRVSRAIDEHGASSTRFSTAISRASFATTLTFGLAGVAGFLLLLV